MHFRPKTLHLVGIGIVILLAAAALHRFPPEQNGFYPRCWVHEHTGLLCPGCGSTRAISHLLHARWKEAFQSNALLILSLPIFIVWITRQLPQWFRGQPAFHLQWSTRWIYGTVAVLFVFTILRNIPGTYTQWLRPPS